MKGFVLGAVAALALGGGVAYATIPDVDGVVYGCYDNFSGQLRVVDPSAGGACTRSESPLNWNQQGPQGPQGAPGPQGHPGIDATNLWAVVWGDGTLIRGKGVTSTWSSTLFPGVYRLTFDRNISQCALSATLGSDSVADYGEVSALIDTGNPAQVMVFTRTVQDDLAGHGDHTAKPFFLEVFC